MRATETNVLSFIGGLDKVFIIPPFQRNYEWRIEQCDELFDDIIKSYKSKKSHYLGNIVYYVGKNSGASYNELILVDGQQRVTTILLLLCALRDSIKDVTISDSVNKRYLINDTGENRFRVRLKQTSYDTQSFMAIIDKKPIDNDINNVTKNYRHFLKLISNSSVDPKDIYETIPKLEVVDVNLQIDNDLGAVQTVFEKINSTGKRLDPADLIRNFLLLSDTYTEQESLYENYWVKIEQKIKNDNISRFVQDYLILNIFEDVPQSKIYNMFKEYFNENEISRVDILKEMYKYSKYYSWINEENSPDVRINGVLKILNYIKSDDLYPLYLYLFNDKYESDKQELFNILKLLSDFMLRYRVVAPSGGGGALRSIIQQLLKGMCLGTIENTYKSIYYELSNSNTPAGRFPNDDEFKNKLKESVNNSYAKVVLLKIEEHEKSNIPIPLDKVTVEHILPQTLNKNWVEYLGGEEEAERIHDTYLNCIGNLAPISQKYNSKISNKPWHEKRQHISDVQFNVTSKIAINHEWKESEIKKRNVEIAERACKAITSPLERTRRYQSKNSTNEFEAGIYPLTDITTPMSGAILEHIIYDNNVIEVNTWKDFLNIICKIAFDINSDLFERVVENNKIHKATSKYNFPQKDPIITEDPNTLVEAKRVGETKYFSEGCISSDRARFYAKQLLELYKVADLMQISVVGKKDHQSFLTV